MALVTRSYNQYVDAMLGPGESHRLSWTWGFAETPQEVGVSARNFVEVSDVRKAWFLHAIEEFASVCNLTITQTESSANPQLLASYDTSLLVYGYSSGATVVFNTSDVNSFPGTYAYHNYLHEIGHSMGLRHPASPHEGFLGRMPADQRRRRQ